MERRSWPWKKKSSEKHSVETGRASISNSGGNQAEEEESRIVNYVQITSEQYSHLTNTEEQVKLLNEKLFALEEKLSAAQCEVTTKEGLVKQHAKVAEEAISGWEKAEAEATALKVQLENVTLSRLASDERAAQLDGALKECMKQIRAVKEESEQQLHDVVFAKTKHWEKLRAELEAEIYKFEQELLRAVAENDALSRSIEEHSNMLRKIGEEKVQAEAEIELLKNTVQSGEREINSLKYELHIALKELAIRSEEKTMSVRSADIASKQHLEDIKKISKLEAECQRLRGLVRKKLPGPAALAQMKMEVENLGREFSDNRLRRSPGRNLSYRPASPQASEFSFDDSQHLQKENEFLAARLLAMEEETKMLKETLSKRNSELVTVKSLYTKTASKLRSMEVQLHTVSQEKSLNSNIDVAFDCTLSQSGSNPPSLTSMSEDGADNERSSPRTCAIAVVPDSKKDNPFELMDDFLEMERLASEANASVRFLDRMKIDSPESDTSAVTENHEDNKATNATLHSQEKTEQLESTALSKLSSRLCSLLDSRSPPAKDVKEIISSIRHVLDDFAEAPISSDDELRNAISRVHDFVKSLRKGNAELQRNPSDKLERFSIMVAKVRLGEKHLRDFIVATADVLPDVDANLLTERAKQAEINNVDFVDKVTLLENKVIMPCSDLENNRARDSGFNSADAQLFSFEEYKQLKAEKANLELQLLNCNDVIDRTNRSLSEMQQDVEKLRSELMSSQKSNGLADTQLKCMAESYRSLESRNLQLEDEIKELQTKVNSLTADLCEERQAHENDLAKYKELEEQLERCGNNKMVEGFDEAKKSKQETEIAAAAEKLAECQETMLLLGRQLQAMRPPVEQASPSPNRQQTDRTDLLDDETSQSGGRHSKNPSAQMDPETAFTGSESPLGAYSPRMMASDSETGPCPRSPSSSKRPKHRSRPSFSASPNAEKQGRGFSRFFSKGRAET